MYLQKQRGAVHSPTNTLPTKTAVQAVATGDLNNDLRIDLVTLANGKVIVQFNGLEETQELSLAKPGAADLLLVDYDNDGWLDIFALGQGLQAFRNKGSPGLRTPPLRLASTRDRRHQPVGRGRHRPRRRLRLVYADDSGLKYLRNDGGNQNLQLKIRLYGNRSNASGLGIQVEGVTGGLRFKRTAQVLPVEIGVGTNALLNSLTARWFDLSLNNVDVEVKRDETVTLTELILPTGSCPYLYCWDGERFRFVTDLLGASPLACRWPRALHRRRSGRNRLDWRRDKLQADRRQLPPADHRGAARDFVPRRGQADCSGRANRHGGSPEYPIAATRPLSRGRAGRLGQAQAAEAGQAQRWLDVTVALQDNDDAWLSPVELRAATARLGQAVLGRAGFRKTGHPLRWPWP